MSVVHKCAHLRADSALHTYDRAYKGLHFVPSSRGASALMRELSQFAGNFALRSPSVRALVATAPVVALALSGAAPPALGAAPPSGRAATAGSAHLHAAKDLVAAAEHASAAPVAQVIEHMLMGRRAAAIADAEATPSARYTGEESSSFTALVGRPGAEPSGVPAGPGGPGGPAGKGQRRGRRPLEGAGAIAAFGDARYLGEPSAHGRDLVAVAAPPAPTPGAYASQELSAGAHPGAGATGPARGEGYWAVDMRGAVFSYGRAGFYGSLAGRHPAGGVASMASTADGRGYWLASRYGGVFAFGDAHFYGSLGKAALRAPITGITPTANGKGYWLVTATGAVYSFGDAKYFGSLEHSHLSGPVIGMAAAARGDGYWLATEGGAVFSFGDAKFFGSAAHAGVHVEAMASTRGADGYWLATQSGTVYGFGAAHAFGSAKALAGARVSAIATSSDGRGYLMATAALGGPAVLPRDRWGVRSRAARRVAAGESRSYLGTFLVTCYDLSGVTASGAFVGLQSAAVDPNVIPLGAHIFIDGIGWRTADDTGGAIIGNHIDVWEPSYQQCVDWGVRYKAVYT